MNLDELQSVQSRERQTDQLQQLRSTFYEEAGQFVNQLREERERAAERADDPFDAPEVNRLTDDIKTAEQTVEAVYERRVGKIVKMASLAAADMPTEEDGLTQEERDLFETMVTAIKQNRNHVLDVIAGEAPTGAVSDNDPAADTGPTGTPAPEPSTPDQSPPDTSTPDQSPPDVPAPDGEDPSESTVDAADIMGGGDGQSSTDPAAQSTAESPSAPDRDAARPSGEAGAIASAESDGPAAPSDSPTNDESSTEDADVARKTVRITDDVGEIFGVDQREYDLSTDDVVTLPADNADPLVERDAAEPLE
ncbi:hypothetical protein [Haloarcula marina]|uniref:hypothetical protein n=1 Tax=Haloarcula marina TaxID=2961574 RepID=UPI0020B7D533|nr:hypothetical protein [Halomicroarcula marina]